jgi:hypothetical protein
MHTKNAVRRTLGAALRSRNVLDKNKTLVLDLSPSRLTLEEAATLAFNSRELRSRYNAHRDLLILEFSAPREKLAYMKRLPQWLWNRGIVRWDASEAQLELWRLEAAGC